ncbi:MAG: hypothetical protein OXC96_05960 [Cyanobacteria bacterium MAG CAR1_bin_15]|nr:hypothetical protein [Cyanobacteria bacterium MAG CAR1_bin_15]
MKDLCNSFYESNNQKINLIDCLKLIKHKKSINCYDCLDAVRKLLPNSLEILQKAFDSAREIKRFQSTEQAFGLLFDLGTKFREAKLVGKRDHDAGKIIFGEKYASNESETAKSNRRAKKERTVSYKGTEEIVWQHLKIGNKESPNCTLRIHFFWDQEDEKIVISHCGKHLYIPPSR